MTSGKNTRLGYWEVELLSLGGDLDIGCVETLACAHRPLASTKYESQDREYFQWAAVHDGVVKEWRRALASFLLNGERSINTQRNKG